MATIDGSAFQAVGGQIYGHLFENRSVGIPRAVYWACTIEFAPLYIDGEDWPSSLLCEWIRWPIRDWRQLSGHMFTAAKDQTHPEASLYLFAQHQPVTSIMLSLGHRHNERFNVSASRASANDLSSTCAGFSVFHIPQP